MSDRAALAHGADPAGAPLSVVLLHGRGRMAGEMIDLAERIALPEVAWRALQAPDSSWYPGGFMDPLEANQPELDQTLARVEQEARALEVLGVSRRRIALVGFSQGACVACEYLRRHPRRWGGLVAFTGGLFGPEGTRWDAPAVLDGTPVLLTNSDQDPFVPWRRVEETANLFRRLGADVAVRLYPGREHRVGEDEIDRARALLQRALAEAQASPALEEES